MPQLIESPLLKNLAQIKHGFFTRLDGVSTGYYDSLNFGFGSQDSQENITKNYQIAANYLNIPKEKIITLKQIHSDICVEITDPKQFKQKLCAGDALITKIKDIAICSLTADCVPILIYAADINYIAAIHSGWQGALSGIVENTLVKLAEHGGQCKNFKAAIMPAINQESYEVGPELREKFLAKNPNNHKFFQENAQGKYQFSLKQYVKSVLEQNNVGEISVSKTDTYQDSENCFSYRRATHKGEADMGRHISFIMLKDD